MKEIPGPTTIFPHLKHVFQFRKGPLQFFQNLERKYPGLCKLRFVPIHAVLVTDPELIKEVLTLPQEKIKKGTHYLELKHVLGNGLVTSERESWFKYRRLVQPAFYKKTIVGFIDVMQKHAETVVKDFRDKSTLSMFEISDYFTSSVLVESMFSKDLSSNNPKFATSFAFLNTWTNKRIQNIINLPPSFPSAANRRFTRELKKLDDFFFELIKKRNEEIGEHHDLLQLFIETEDQDSKERMNNVEVRDELVTILAAGTETTAITISWMFYLLGKHPEIQQKIKAELNEKVGDGDLNFEKITQLTYLRAVLSETLRMYPAIWALSRQTRQAITLGGYAIGKSWDLIISPYVMHRSEHFWSHPDDFIPERFLTDDLKSMHKYAYMPFGGGPRICVGEHFAILEIMVLMANLFSKGSLQTDPNITLIPQALVTLRPHSDLPISYIPD